MQHSGALGEYISTVKTKARDAAESLSRQIDDLDIGDFAYIQRIALHADGHPLGDYLSWLLSSHLTALAFEGSLRVQQVAVDRMEFEDGPLSPAEPSTELAALYHDALFARNLGPLGRHPRAGEGSVIADVPFVQLGDVFLTPDKTRAVVVLSPDCDLAFSTDPTRMPDRNLGVILMFGDPNSVASDAGKDTSTTTEGMLDGAEVYRIDWRFNSFRTVRLYLYVAIDRTSKFAFVQVVRKTGRTSASAFLMALIEAVPYRIHTVLTDNGIQFTFPPRYADGPTARYMTHMFDMRCRENGIEHRLTKVKHPWTNGQVERMNRTIKEATVKRFHYDDHQQFETHLSNFVSAYNFARRLKTLKGLTPYEFVCKQWTSEPERFKLDPIHQMPGLNT